MTKKLSLTAQWMRDHPEDVPCPQGHSDAQMWRRQRGLEARPGEPEREALRQKYEQKYEQAMIEKRARQTLA
jgi:hypothetical protein